MLLDIKPNYTPPKMDIWQGRKDSLANERFFQAITCLDLSQQSLPNLESSVALLGFCSDEGVKRNLGRVGAADGPDAIRKQLGGLALHRDLNLIDCGNIACIDNDLEAAQEKLGVVTDYLHQHNMPTIVLGGGHEVSYGHYLGLSSHYDDLAIINFDAHFDLRKAAKASSGTPFLQIAEHRAKHNLAFQYCCLGIQPRANTTSLYETADSLSVQYLTGFQIASESLSWQKAFIEDFLLSTNHVYLSVCMDVFDESIAPGVSAPQPLGLSPQQVLILIDTILQSGKVVSCDIAETSPKLDKDEKTTRLAAQIAATLI